MAVGGVSRTRGDVAARGKLDAAAAEEEKGVLSSMGRSTICTGEVSFAAVAGRLTLLASESSAEEEGEDGDMEEEGDTEETGEVEDGGEDMDPVLGERRGSIFS